MYFRPWPPCAKSPPRRTKSGAKAMTASTAAAMYSKLLYRPWCGSVMSPNAQARERRRQSRDRNRRLNHVQPGGLESPIGVAGGPETNDPAGSDRGPFEKCATIQNSRSPFPRKAGRRVDYRIRFAPGQSRSRRLTNCSADTARRDKKPIGPYSSPTGSSPAEVEYDDRIATAHVGHPQPQKAGRNRRNLG